MFSSRASLILTGSRHIDAYEHLNKIDEGSYGVVYRARDKQSNEIVAIKKIKLDKEKEGFPITSIREISILLSIEHENIIRYNEVVYGSSLDKIYSVMEYMDFELKALLSQSIYVLTLPNIKCLMFQLLKGVEYMHSKWIIHRDLKTSNLLVNKDGILKIGDFGLARKYSDPLGKYTPLVVTLWYRAPEILLYCDKYGTSVDMWSCGCIMGELFTRDAVIKGQDELDQLNKIFKLVGSISEEVWPGWKIKCGSKVQQIVLKSFPNTIEEKFSALISNTGIDLLSKLLTLNPEKRITAADALQHPWFNETPVQCDPCEMPAFPELNDKEREMLRNQRKDSLDDVQLKQRENFHEEIFPNQ